MDSQCESEKQHLKSDDNHLNIRSGAKEIGVLSPQPPVYPKGKKSSAKNRGKISISSYNKAVVNVEDGPRSPEPNRTNRLQSGKHHSKKALFLTPEVSKTNGNTVASSALFSPSKDGKSTNKSMSTATPKKHYAVSKKSGSQLSKTDSNSKKKNDSQSSSVNEIIVASRFRLLKKIGKGSFGVAYEALDLLTNDRIAIKLERKREDRRSSQSAAVNSREITILEKLDKCNRVPKLIWHGAYKQYRVMALELQGMNLSDLYDICDRHFSLKTIIYILIECIYCIEDIHSKGIVHRDIKPQNFIVNRNPTSNKLHVIDFGLSSWFKTSIGGHIPFNDQCSPVGTARYASIHNHKGVHQTRRDDLESIGYMMVFFLKKELPWQGMREPRRVKKWRKIQQKKESVSCYDLTQGLPNEFTYYLDTVRKLEYDEKPDYKKLIRVFKRLYKRQGFYDEDMKRMNPNHKKQSFDFDVNAIGDVDNDDDLNWNVADITIPDWIECDDAE